MKKMMCVILGLAFVAMGILGITGLMPVFQSDPVYLNIGEIVLGGLGFLVGVYSPQKNMLYKQENEIERLRKEIDQQRKEIDQQRKEIDEQKKANEKDSKIIEHDKQIHIES